VLERVIKARYEILSKNFAETSAALERLAHESVKEKKKKKKIVKDYNSLWRVVYAFEEKGQVIKVASYVFKTSASTTC
jgi:Zn/Cd-binding protein ZinT